MFHCYKFEQNKFLFNESSVKFLIRLAFQPFERGSRLERVRLIPELLKVPKITCLIAMNTNNINSLFNEFLIR